MQKLRMLQHRIMKVMMLIYILFLVRDILHSKVPLGAFRDCNSFVYDQIATSDHLVNAAEGVVRSKNALVSSGDISKHVMVPLNEGEHSQNPLAMIHESNLSLERRLKELGNEED